MTVSITGLTGGGECIKLEVNYEANSDFKECGDCITADSEVDLAVWCQQTRKNVGDVEDVQAKFCRMYGEICSDGIIVRKGIYEGLLILSL